MKEFAKIAVLVVAVCGVYTGVGSLVPQKEEHPPAKASNIEDPRALAETGKSVFASQCTQCHGTPGGGGTDRAPDVDGVASRAESRAEYCSKETGKPYSADDYLAESLFDPGACLVERSPGVKYGNIMSFKLEPVQILALLAYLQSLGGTATATASSDVWTKWGSPIEEGAGEGGGAVAAACEPKPQGEPDAVFKDYGCAGCHETDKPGVKSGGGPSLWDIGKRMSRGDILLAILEPDFEMAKPPEGVTFAPGLMSNTLVTNGFYCDVGREDKEKLVNWLAAKQGGAEGNPVP